MSGLSQDQLSQLNNYSNYLDDTQQKIFSLQQLFNDDFLSDLKNILKVLTKNDSDSIAISYFSRRYGMFIAMQLYMLTVYDEVWCGNFEDLQFGIREEFNRPSLCMFTKSEDWQMIDEEDRQKNVTKILHKQCHDVFIQLKKLGTLSPLTHWENIFGYVLWHYHTLLSSPATIDEATEYLAILEDPVTWIDFSTTSRFHSYTGGAHPSTLINIPVRKTCCFSKDIPGLIACGFCPLN